MRLSQYLLFACALGFFAALSLPAQAAALSDAEKAEVEAIVRELLTKKEPQIVMKAAQAIQESAEAETAARSTEAMSKFAEKISNDPTSPVGGNPKGDVTVVEFFDYMCGYCKAVYPAVSKLLKEDGQVRFVYKEIPILGETSAVAAKAALASAKQGKYEAFHAALMGSKDRLTDSSIFKIAEKTGLDVEKLKKDMEDNKIEEAIKGNVELAKELGINGTPSFIINNKIYPGAIPFEEMKKAVDQARKDAKKKK